MIHRLFGGRRASTKISVAAVGDTASSPTAYSHPNGPEDGIALNPLEARAKPTPPPYADPMATIYKQEHKDDSKSSALGRSVDDTQSSSPPLSVLRTLTIVEESDIKYFTWVEAQFAMDLYGRAFIILFFVVIMVSLFAQLPSYAY
jgi:hypothetical protein